MNGFFKTKASQKRVKLLGRESFIFVVLSMFIIASAWAIISRVEEEEKTDIAKYLVTILESAHANINNQLTGQKKRVVDWANGIQIRSVTTKLASLPRDVKTLTENQSRLDLQSIINLVSNTRGYEGFYIIGKDKVNLASSNYEIIGSISFPGENDRFLEKIWAGATLHFHPQYFNAPRDGLKQEPVDNLATMIVATPIKNKEDEIIAIFVLQLDLDLAFSSIFRHSHFGSSGETYAFNQNAFMISDSRFKEQFISKGLMASGHSHLAVSLRNPESNIVSGEVPSLPLDKQPLTLMAQSAINGESGMNLNGYKDYRGVPVAGAWLWDDELGFGVATEVDMEEAFESFRNIRTIIVAFTLLAIGTLAVYAITSSISRRKIIRGQKRYHDSINLTTEGYWLIDTAARILEVNTALCSMLGREPSELIGKTPADFLSHKSRLTPSAILTTDHRAYEASFIKKSGETVYTNVNASTIWNDKGEATGAFAFITDITERKENEENLRHAQKMDAIGQLTGGIAHDFNNVLGVVLGFAELLKNHVGDKDPKSLNYCDQIIKAGERASKLTSKLLAFSGKVPATEETAYINVLVQDMQDMLEKTLTPRIKLIMELEENLWPVMLDKARLEDAILNISINAMHAMPDGGVLTLRTSNMHSADLDALNIDITPGDYVLLSISDTGVGMNKETQQKMFEPFFTTKGTKGTGLGMSQVYGFVQQSGGTIQVYSEPGHGTQIAFYLPRHQESEAVSPEHMITDTVESPSGQETILVVDDEVLLLDLTEEILTTYGYTVLRAESAEQALNILKNNSVDLLLSDAIMPDMDGYQLATEVKKHYPMIKIQIASGFSDNHRKSLSSNKWYQQRLHKPLSSGQLLRRIRNLLDEE